MPINSPTWLDCRLILAAAYWISSARMKPKNRSAGAGLV